MNNSIRIIKIGSLCILFVTILLAQLNWVPLSGTSSDPIAPESEVMRSNTSSVYIRNTTFGFTRNDTTVDSKDFVRIAIPGEEVDYDVDNIGKPQIPYIRILVAVPDSATLSYNARCTEPILVEDQLVYPVPEINFADSVGWTTQYEEYTFDTTFYNTDTLYPGVYYEIVNDGHWRDQRIIEVLIYPIQCNPKHEFLLFHTGMDLEVTYSGTIINNPNGLGPFDRIARDMLLNYNGIDDIAIHNEDAEVHYYTDLKDSSNVADYIIVTHEDFLGCNDSIYIHDLAEWRVDHNNYEVGVVKMSDVYEEFPPSQPTDSAKSLREFLIYAYDVWYAPASPDSHFTYSLMIGDWDYVPMETCFVNYPGTWTRMNAYEGYFRDIDSDEIDQFDDIMVGRWPAKILEIHPNTYVKVLVQKTLDYEETPSLGDWRRRSLSIAGPGQGYQYCSPEVDTITWYSSDIGYDSMTIRYDVLSQQFPNPDSMFQDTLHDLLNIGEIVTAFYGHGSLKGWHYEYGSDNFAPLLTNKDSFPAIFSYACNTAGFQFDHPYYDTLGGWWGMDTCLGECFLWNPNGGAIAFFGGTGPLYMHKYTSIPVNRTFQQQHWTLGEALINAYMSSSHNSKTDCYTLLGDPALDLGDYTAYPNSPDLVVRPQGIDISLANYPYYTGGDTIPINYFVWNVGGDTAFNISIDVDVVNSSDDTIYSSTQTIHTLIPRAFQDVEAKWNTAATHPFFYGTLGDCDIYVNADPDDNIEESWEYNNTSHLERQLVLYPYRSGWPLKITRGTQQPAIGNLDESGSVEIVYPCTDSVYVYNYQGTVMLNWPKYMKNVHSVVIADLDCMGDLEIIAVSSESVTVFNYQGGTVSGWPKPVPNSDPNNYEFVGFPSVGYIEGSEKRQVVVGVRGEQIGGPHGDDLFEMGVMVYDYDGDSLYYLTYDSMYCNSKYCKGVAISDVNYDGKDEIVVSHVYATGDPPVDTSITDIFNKNGRVRKLPYGSCGLIPALADFNYPLADGVADIVVGDMNDTIRVYNERNQTTFWKTKTGGPINSSPAVGNIHPTYNPNEIAFGCDDHKIWAVRGDNGNTWGNYPASTDTIVTNSPALAKLSGKFDLYPDIVLAADDWTIYGLDYNKQNKSPYPLPVFNKPSSVVIGDIDGLDRKSETILATEDGYLHVWINKSSYMITPYKLEWPQFMHNYQRTGLYDWVGGLGGGGDAKASPEEFSTATTISFSLERKSLVEITVYDAEGNVVRNLVSQLLPKGSYNPVWFGTNNYNAALPNGTYIIEIEIDNYQKAIPVSIKR